MIKENLERRKIMNAGFYVKKYVYGILASLLVMGLCIMPTYAWGRKLITKPISGSLDVSGNIMNYSFNSTAGITYNDSNNITDISDLSFGYITITMSNHRYTGNVIPRMQSKYYSRNTATYTVQVTRTFQGYYSDKINYTLTYRSTDAGTPYSLNVERDWLLVDITESEPYDIVYFE